MIVSAGPLERAMRVLITAVEVFEFGPRAGGKEGDAEG